MAKPTQTDPQFKLRMPQHLKDAIEAATLTSGRSMNSEIVERLLETFDLDRHQAVFLVRIGMQSDKATLLDSAKRLRDYADLMEYFAENADPGVGLRNI